MSEKEKVEHQRELELLQAQHQEDLNQLKQSYERQIKELKDTVDKLTETSSSGHESADERSVSNDILSTSDENCQKLRDQIKLTKELDKDLIEKLNQQEVELKQKQLDSQQVMPNEIKDILEDSPSLKNFLLEIFPKIYASAIASVREEYPQINFPDHWLEEYDINAILNRNFWQED